MERPFEALLHEFRKLPPAVRRSPTFLEVAGYPHYENVCSNLMAFFLDPNNPHGLGNLLLDALADAGPINGVTEGAHANVAVERELTTNMGNRLDILIESDTLIIAIENKIFHAAANPFADYAEFINRRNVNGKTVCKFLLTLDPSDAGSTSGFKNLTYPQFIDAIRQHLGYHTVHTDTRYLVLLIELLNTLENLRMGTHMNLQFVGLLAEESEAVVELLEAVDEFREELRQKVKELGALIDLSRWPTVQQSLYRESRGLFDVLVHDIPISYEVPVRIDTEISPRGWRIGIWFFRSGDRAKRQSLGKDQTELRRRLQSLPIPFEEGEKFIYPECFAYTEPLERLQPVIQDLIDKIARAQ